jgi:NADPH-dependent 2,4-dienoyl-CoA reductase/sulfur reductase-like enzyme
MSFRFGEEVASVVSSGRGTITTLVSGKRIAAEVVMHSAGRQGNTTSLNLDLAGLAADKRGRLVVNANYQTEAPHIYAVGDVIGFPALAATSMDQGRLAAAHAFNEPANELHGLQPIGIYTIPEISYCGRTEGDLTREAIPFEVGISRYRELARGQIIGDSYGMLKLIVHAETREILGVHIFGYERDRTRPHRPGHHGLAGHRRLPRRHRAELPDPVRGLQGGRTRRRQQAPRGRPLHHSDGDIRTQHVVTRTAPGQTLRRTATTLPRIVAWLPSIGSYA